MTVQRLPAWLGKHWFIPCSVVLLIVGISVRDALPVPLDSAVSVLALVVGLPLACALCYRNGTRRGLAVRCATLLLMALWGIGLLYPGGEQGWLKYILWLQYGKWPLILYLEMQVAGTLWRVVRKERKPIGDAYDLMVKENSIPAWTGALAKWELAFWKKVGARLAAFKRGTAK